MVMENEIVRFQESRNKIGRGEGRERAREILNGHKERENKHRGNETVEDRTDERDGGRETAIDCGKSSEQDFLVADHFKKHSKR